MKTKALLSILMMTFFSLYGINTSNAQYVSVDEHNYKINIPSNWSKSIYNEGTDKVLDIMSSDEQIAIQIRSFALGADVEAQKLANMFNDGLIQEGAQQLNLSDQELNGIPGVMGVYSQNSDGTNMAIITFSIVKNQVGYLLFTVIPANMFDHRSQEADNILNTFTITSDVSEQNMFVESVPTSKGLGSLSGSTSNHSTTSSGMVKSNYVTISGNGWNDTYTFVSSGSYPIKFNKNVVIRGLDRSGTNALEIYLYNHQGTGTFSYGSGDIGGKKFIVGAVNGKSVSSNNASGSGSLTVTTYQEGGKIEGHFTATVGGHEIKGQFLLDLSTPKGYGGY